MKRTSLQNKISAATLAALLGAGALLSAGCNNEKLVAIDEPPPAPQGVFTIRGDQQVTIYWLPVEASDLDYYRIYWGADSSNGSSFSLVGTSNDEMYVDDVSLSNGTRYYYVVTAVDLAGNESAQSREWGGATPRDEDAVYVGISNDNPSNAGFDLSVGSTLPFNSVYADIWFDRDGGGNVYINADSIADPNLGDLQDMGYTESLDEIGRAPIDGWSILGYAEAIEGHTYVIWTDDDHYAKVRILDIQPTVVYIEYAYQPGDAWAGGGEPELAPSVRGAATTTTTRADLRTGEVKAKTTSSGGAQ